MYSRCTHTLVSFIFLISIVLLMEGCKLGYNKPSTRASTNIPAPDCADRPINPNADENASGVFRLLADLTCGVLFKSNDGYLMGQSTGNGNQIAVVDHPNSYVLLIDEFTVQAKKTPAIVSIDYEYERLYTYNELVQANDKLDEHWGKGGFVTISWTPLNPWLNNFTDIENTPGSHSDTAYSDNVDLTKLLDPNTEIYTVWRNKLDAVANALDNLQKRDRSVTVLWRPLPEMNTSEYWWGLDASKTEDEPDATLYTELWEDMYDYLTNEKGLKNLLWVYSPAESREAENTKVGWAYPGENFVDVVAGIALNDQLTIKDYIELKDFNKPLGMAEFGPKRAGNYSATGTFDNTTYADRLNGSYNFVSYWVSGYSTVGAKQSLIDNLKSKELAERSYIFNAEDKKRGE